MREVLVQSESVGVASIVVGRSQPAIYHNIAIVGATFTTDRNSASRLVDCTVADQTNKPWTIRAIGYRL